MLVGLTKAWRKRAAAFVVALYALCLLAPTSVFGFADIAAKAHCLAQATGASDHAGGHHHPGKAQDHKAHAGMMHEHAGDATPAPAAADHGVPGQCCGLFCVSALAMPDFGSAEMRTIEISVISLPMSASLLGLSGDRIDRPPRFLPSL